MPWISVILRIIEGFLGWKKAKSQLELETVGDRRQEAAEAKAVDRGNQAEDRIKHMADALARADACRRKGDLDGAREAMLEVETLQRNRDRDVPLGV